MSLFDFSGIKKLLGDAGAMIRSKRAELESLKRERDILAAAPLSKEDTVKAMHRRIDAEGARHMATLSAAVRQLVVGGGNPDRIDMPILATTKPDYAPSPLSMEAGMCLAFGDQMKAAASRIIEAMPWPEHAMDHRDKTERLAKLDAKIAAVESDVRGMVESARGAGLNF